MASKIDLDSKHKPSYYSNFETRSSNGLKLMERIFGRVPINHVNIEPSFTNENWPRFNVFSKGNSTANSPPVQSILSSFIV